MNELKFRLRSLLTLSVDTYLGTLTTVVDSMDRAAEVNEEKARRFNKQANALIAKSNAAYKERDRAERIADKFRDLID